VVTLTSIHSFFVQSENINICIKNSLDRSNNVPQNICFTFFPLTNKTFCPIEYLHGKWRYIYLAIKFVLVCKSWHWNETILFKLRTVSQHLYNIPIYMVLKVFGIKALIMYIINNYINRSILRKDFFEKCIILY